MARALSLPFDLWLVRSLLLPGCEYLPLGVLDSGGAVLSHRDVPQGEDPSVFEIDSLIRHERAQLEREQRFYREGSGNPSVKDRTVVLVDDGTTSRTAIFAAVEVFRQRSAAKVIVALPAACADLRSQLRMVADRVITGSGSVPPAFVAEWYKEFQPVKNDEIPILLSESRRTGSFSEKPSPGTTGLGHAVAV